jgi:hypothetical protein
MCGGGLPLPHIKTSTAQQTVTVTVCSNCGYQWQRKVKWGSAPKASQENTIKIDESQRSNVMTTTFDRDTHTANLNDDQFARFEQMEAEAEEKVFAGKRDEEWLNNRLFEIVAELESNTMIKIVATTHHHQDRADGGFTTYESAEGQTFVRWVGRYGASFRLVPLEKAQGWDGYDLDPHAVRYPCDWECSLEKVYSAN